MKGAKRLLKKAKELGLFCVHIGSDPASSMEPYTDHFVCIPAPNRKKTTNASSVQPMTSLFEQSLLLFGDILALVYIRKHQLNLDELWEWHANLE